ncbi:MAG: ATP-dependent RNA helicase DeaD, partial [Candidatus Azotimanducaceae bacterium]
VGAIANEAGLDASNIGSIDIQDDHTLIDLPEGMPRDVFRDLKKTWVCGRRLNISKYDPVARKQREEDTSDKKRKPRSKKPEEAGEGKSKRKPRSPSGEKKKTVKNKKRKPSVES